MPKTTVNFFLFLQYKCFERIHFVVNPDFQAFLFHQNTCQVVVWKEENWVHSQETESLALAPIGETSGKLLPLLSYKKEVRSAILSVSGWMRWES